MIKKYLNAYFSDKTYNMIYAHHFLRNIPSSILYIFTGAYFLKIGMPLHYVLLFYGLEFGLRGSLCPLGLKFFQKVGVKTALLISALFMMVFFVGISFADQNLFIGFFSLIFAAISGAIYYPLLDVLEAVYVTEDKDRTKQMSMGIIAGSIGRVLGAAGAGFLLGQYGFNSVIIVTSITLLLSVLPFYILHEPDVNMPPVKATDVYKFMGDDNFKPLLIPFFGLQLMIIVRVAIIPLFIFSIVQELDDLGYLIALTLIAEKIFTLCAGHITDRHGISKTTRFSVFSYSSAIAAYILLAKTPLSVFFIESYYKIVGNIFDSASRSGFHRYAREKYPNKLLFFGAAWQMTLCFGELITLPLYGLLAYFIGENIFYVGFATAIIGAWLVDRHFQRQSMIAK